MSNGTVESPTWLSYAIMPTTTTTNPQPQCQITNLWRTVCSVSWHPLCWTANGSRGLKPFFMMKTNVYIQFAIFQAPMLNPQHFRMVRDISSFHTFWTTKACEQYATLTVHRCLLVAQAPSPFKSHQVGLVDGWRWTESSFPPFSREIGKDDGKNSVRFRHVPNSCGQWREPPPQPWSLLYGVPKPSVRRHRATRLLQLGDTKPGSEGHPAAEMFTAGFGEQRGGTVSGRGVGTHGWF